MRLPQRISFSFHSALRLLVKDYFLGLAVFTILRILFIFFNHAAAELVPEKWLALSVLRGIQFDSVSCGIILSLPWLITFCGLIWEKEERKFRKAAFITTNIFFILAFFAAFADMPLFMQFGKRLSVASLLWSSSPGFIFKLIFSNWMHMLLIFFFICFSFLFYLVRRRAARRIADASPVYFSKSKNVIAAVLCGVMLLLAIRGRISLKSPIRWGTAYFCTNAFANQTVLNPFYTFLTSAVAPAVHTRQEYYSMKKELAEKIYSDNSGKGNPVKITSQPVTPKRNVIIVVMESMAGWKTGLYPSGLKWTPNLDALSKEGIFFSDFYSDGIHTFNGLYSTLTGSQCLPKIQPLSDMNLNSDPVTLAELLKAQNYSTVFFTTHDAEFDNMNGFMRGNGFDEVMSEHDYDFATGMNPMGVPDHILFNEARKKIRQLSANGKPFFATLLTGSDHEPFIVPEEISYGTRRKDARENAVVYADWSIGKFKRDCEKEPWYANTIFIFVADHGGVLPGAANDMYLAFHHIPCIILGAGIRPQINNSLGTQADILPTVMRLLRLDYKNEFMGIDLLSQKRKRLFFTYDEDICSLDSTSFYVDRAIDPHLFMRNEAESNCGGSTNAEKIKEHKEFIAATLQLLGEHFFTPL
ncbi:LTA synthase family protein [soil metagenome]